MLSNNIFFRVIIRFCLSIVLLCGDSLLLVDAYASEQALPSPNALLMATAQYDAPTLVGMSFDVEDQSKFRFLFDSNDETKIGTKAAEEALRFFLAALAMPNDALWVNLSPYENDRVIDQRFASTELGRGFLEQDYLLKLFSSSLTKPDTTTGKEYWSTKLMNQAKGIELDEAMAKIWISPRIAAIYEKENSVLITKADLKVRTGSLNKDLTTSEGSNLNPLLPLIENEVNNAKSFSRLRQMYRAVILARWFKERVYEHLINSYANSANVTGIDLEDSEYRNEIWKKYCRSFEMGVYEQIARNPLKPKEKRNFIAGGIDCYEIDFSSSALSEFRAKGNLIEASAQLKKVSSAVVKFDPKKDVALSDKVLAKYFVNGKRKTAIIRAAVETLKLPTYIRYSGTKGMDCFALSQDNLERIAQESGVALIDLSLSNYDSKIDLSLSRNELAKHFIGVNRKIEVVKAAVEALKIPTYKRQNRAYVVDCIELTKGNLELISKETGIKLKESSTTEFDKLKDVAISRGGLDEYFIGGAKYVEPIKASVKKLKIETYKRVNGNRTSDCFANSLDNLERISKETGIELKNSDLKKYDPKKDVMMTVTGISKYFLNGIKKIKVLKAAVKKLEIPLYERQSGSHVVECFSLNQNTLEKISQESGLSIRKEETISEFNGSKDVSISVNGFREYFVNAINHMDELKNAITELKIPTYKRMRSSISLDCFALSPENLRNISNITGVELKDNGKYYETIIEELDLNEAIALLGDDALRLQQYIRLFHPDLMPEDIDNVVIAGMSQFSKVQAAKEDKEDDDNDEEEKRNSHEDALLGLISMKEEQLTKILRDDVRNRFLQKMLVTSYLRHFTKDEDEGFAYLKEQIAAETNLTKRQLLKSVEGKLLEVAAMDFSEHIKEGHDLYFFQKYSIYEMDSLRDQGAGGVLLGSDPGLGKTVTALAFLGDNKSTIIAPNSVVTSWAEQAEIFMKKAQIDVLDGKHVERDKKLATISRPQIVTNVEYVRKLTKERQRGLSQKQGVLVVDEADYLGNPKSKQAQGTAKLEAAYKLLMSATPFNRPSQMMHVLKFLRPHDKRFASGHAFAKAFPLSSSESMNALHMLIQEHMVRIRKEDVFSTYDPNIPLEDQKGCLPAKEEISPDKLGSFELSVAQMESIKDLFMDYQKWCREHKGQESDEDKSYYRYDEGYFSKREALRQIMNDPAYIGRSDIESPKHLAMDQIINLELEADQTRKGVIFCRYKWQVREYLKRYSKYGARAYYGDLEQNKDGYYIDESGSLVYFAVDEYENYELENGKPVVADAKNGRPMRALDYERILFQNDPESRVLIATYDAGAVGVTFTAADFLVDDDVAESYRDQYQSDDRIHRIDELRKKYSVRYYRLQANYLESYLEKFKKEYGMDAFNKYFAMGTYDELKQSILAAQKKIFHRIMDGVGDMDQISAMNQKIMKEAMPFMFESNSTEESASSSLSYGGIEMQNFVLQGNQNSSSTIKSSEMLSSKINYGYTFVLEKLEPLNSVDIFIANN